MRKFAVAVVAGAVALAGCSSSGKVASTKSTIGGTTTTTASAASTTTSGTSPTTSAASPTTNTAAPATNGSPGISATFVSTSRGFAVERSGQVDGTTDGGRTWHRVGSLPNTTPEEVIRFIGPSDGFAFTPLSGPLRITHDGGATWVPVSNAPFSSVADLAIARGTIYAVDLHLGGAARVEIWSTPVAHLVWKRDPLTLSVGAGPVAVEKIVLAGGTGWILDVNRTVIAGARLTANGTWAKWTPACATFGGAALLAASTGTDLVAVCSPGPGSTSPASGIQFSHDGGSTFSSRTIPGVKFGVNGLLSPTAHTAVILNSGKVQRTTDDGVTWHDVATVGGSFGATDDGFTTTTQGFLIAGGAMFMTYDAGATWQRVTLP